jgi:cellulose synthase/poly-beta-1,6-N-acetylglucosamine synthase-like glycosyltransferase
MSEEAAMDTKSRPSVVNRIKDWIAIASDWTHDWTPFILVLMYYVVSICIYFVCSESFIAVFWFIYMTSNFYIAGSTVVEAFVALGPIRESRKAVQKAQDKKWVFPTPDDKLLVLDLIIVAYLPNEKDIIMDRALYLLEKIIYPKDKIRINVVYNTPRPIEPLETELWNLAAKHSNLRVIKVPGSTSKADNLNYFFSLNTGSDVIAVYDCDHYPHPYGPRWAIERMISNKKIDIVQGRCIVFNVDESWLASIIAVEFDKIYAVSHPGRAAMWGFGLFTGSNGYWRASLLRSMKMNGDMLTEDIDSALRAVANNCKTVHDSNVVSYELAPVTWQSFWKQRLRWSQGWTQASIKHIIMTWNKPMNGQRGFIMRFGLFSLLFIREISYYLVTQFTILVFTMVIIRFPQSGQQLANLIFFTYPVSAWFFIIRYVLSQAPTSITNAFPSIVCLILTLWITNMVKSEFVSRWMIIQFSLLYPLYLTLFATIGLYGHARQVIRYSSWNPTARS